MNELVGAAEIAERFGLSQPKRVHDWRRRYPDFPQPVATLRAGLVWGMGPMSRSGPARRDGAPMAGPHDSNEKPQVRVEGSAYRGKTRP